MKIASESEFALYMITAGQADMINPAHARVGDTITLPEQGRGVKVKHIEFPESCRPECVHINRTLCYDMRVDVQVKRG